MDMRSNTEGITTLESNEQQRNWTKDHWKNKAADSLANYDPTRAHLNFEVARGGIVQPIDKTKTIDQKMCESLQERGIRNPNDRPGIKRKQRILAQFVFGGDREMMQQLAWGNQAVDTGKGADNSSVVRSPDIEQWAKDVYNFVAKKFGEENIVSFYVHCDELNPHVHCTLLPVKDGKLSYRAVFGNSIREESDNMTKLHDELWLEVGKNCGFERGSNMAETKAKHRSTEEYKRDLVREVENLEKEEKSLQQQIRDAERKVKSFTTMIANLEQQRQNIQTAIDQIAELFGKEGTNNAELAEEMKRLRLQLQKKDEQLATRQQQLAETIEFLKNARAQIDAMKEEHRQWQSVLNDDAQIKALVVEHNLFSTFINLMQESFDPVKQTLSPHQKSILEDSGFMDFSENDRSILELAGYLALGYIHEATNYVNSHGGSSSSLSGWGRKKDEDDEQWWRRSIRTAASALKPARKMGRRR